MLHITTAESAVIKGKLYDALTNITEGYDNEYIIDLPIMTDDDQFVMQIDCSKKEAKVFVGDDETKEFEITKRGAQQSTLFNREDTSYEEYQLLLAINKITVGSLRKKLDEKITKRESIHADIMHGLEGDVSDNKASERNRKKEIPKEKIIEANFNKQYDAVKDAIGFTSRSTQVTINAFGQINLGVVKPKYYIFLEEKITKNSGESHTHRVEYDTLLKHCAYFIDGREAPMSDLIASVHCSVDFKKATDIMVLTLDKMIEGTDKLVETAKINGLNILKEDTEFNNFKKTHIE